MATNQPHLKEHLYQSVIDWQQSGLTALSESALQVSIGRRKAKRMTRLIKGAGTMMIEGYEGEIISTTPSSNGLYFVPTHDSIPKDYFFDIPYGDCAFRFQVGEMTGKTGHVSIEGLPDRHFIVYPINNGLAGADKAAVSVHEATHADQFRQGRRLKAENSLQSATRQEAEAYEDTFKVVNYYWGLALNSVVTENMFNRNLGVVQFFDKHKLREKVVSSKVAGGALAAVIRNIVHGYVANGSNVPSLELSEEYKYLNLLTHP